MQLFCGMKMTPHLSLAEPKAMLLRVCFHFFKAKLLREQEDKWKSNQSQLWGNSGITMHSAQHPDCSKCSSVPRCTHAVAENSHTTPWAQCIDACAFALPLGKLPDLRYAHVFVEMVQHVDHSLQQVGHLTILPLPGHGSATQRHKNAMISEKVEQFLDHMWLCAAAVLIAENRPPSLKTGHRIKKHVYVKKNDERPCVDDTARFCFHSNH